MLCFTLPNKTNLEFYFSHNKDQVHSNQNKHKLYINFSSQHSTVHKHTKIIAFRHFNLCSYFMSFTKSLAFE